MCSRRWKRHHHSCVPLRRLPWTRLGPFEKGTTKAYFNVTLPKPVGRRNVLLNTWLQFNVGTLVSTGVHEAYPGHYVQFLWQDQFPSKVRKLIGSGNQHRGLGPLLRTDDAGRRLRATRCRRERTLAKADSSG